MPSRRLVTLFCLAIGLAAAGHAHAAGFGAFQHGGRATGQVGAFTARADEPSALTYNPAGIVRLDGFQAQAGLDFSNTVDRYESASGVFETKHIIDFPPAAYVTWKPDGRPWALGIGLDTPFWSNIDWLPALFPGRFLSNGFELRVFELHPVLAYDLGDGWSVGAGIRYLYGSLSQGDSELLTVPYSPAPSAPVQPVVVEVERNADATDVDALTWDLSVQYTDTSWGWGAVYRGNAELKGSGDANYTGRSSGIPALDTQVAGQLGKAGASEAFEIPRELRGGFWVAPYPELRLELDVSWMSWSSLEATSVTWSPDRLHGSLSTPSNTTVLTPRDWEDTLSLRLGIEGNITDPFIVYGGIAMEPSPVPGKTVEPGFPRGDALVYAIGASYSFPKVSFDFGYSFHDHDSRGVSNQEPLHPGVNGSYDNRAQVWAFSARWRL